MPPGFPLQTHCFFGFLGFFTFSRYFFLFSFFVSPLQNGLIDLSFFVFPLLFYRNCLQVVHVPSSFSALLLSRVRLFPSSWLFLSTWLFDLFCCCLYIFLLFLLFLKFHLYYILGPRDHPDIVDSFMQLQAQVCFWFLISFTLGFSLLFRCPFLSHFLFLSVLCHGLFRPLFCSGSGIDLRGFPIGWLTALSSNSHTEHLQSVHISFVSKSCYL